MKIYLAGGMKGFAWQDEFINAFPEHEFLDPRSWQVENMHENDYTKLDLEAIDQSQLVIAYMDSSNPSGYGMAFECGYAAGKGIPVLFVDALRNDWRRKYFGMVRATSVDFCNSLKNGKISLDYYGKYGTWTL